MKTLVFLLEELSMRRFLEGLLPRIIGDRMAVQFLVFEGKQDLENQMVRKLRGWQTPDTAFFVVRDQDSADCKSVKGRLVAKCRDAGRPDAVVRVACRELEAWYLGDTEALSVAYADHSIASLGRKAKFRDPDVIGNPSQELKAHVPTFQKTDGGRRMGPLVDINGRNSSKSFGCFLASIRRFVA